MKKFAVAKAFIRRYHWLDGVILGLGLVIFGVITFAHVSAASIWFDEAFSAYIAQFSFAEIAQFTAADVHPPVYYWLLKLWTEFFGTTEAAFRSMSILFGGIAIVAAFFLSRQFFGRKVAWVSLLFLVLSPLLIRYSDEARMYTLAAAIVLTATWVLSKAVASKKWGWWVAYGVLVSLGMWTHYFTAVIWIAHWAWHGMSIPRKNAKEWLKEFFAPPWVAAYGLAIALYLPWIPSLFAQTKSVQSGFWIGPVGPDTVTNYLTNFFYYLEHGQVTGWWALIFLAIVVLTVVLIPRTYKALKKPEKTAYLLVIAMAWGGPLVLFLLSLPPLSSVFVERYLVPSIVALSMFFAVTLVAGTKKWRPYVRVLPVVIVVGMMLFGITNVYTYGNFNKNSNTHILTKEVIQEIQATSPKGTPIVANSPWVFYEAVFYGTEDYPVYFIDEATEYTYGSLNMLRDRDLHKITNLGEFEEQHSVIWYLGGTSDADVAPYQDDWRKIQTVSVYDTITKKEVYKATEYQVSGE